MRFRLALSLAVAALVLTASAACTPDPAPTPTPTGFATEEEAFAAAEQTYREYVDALNAHRTDATAPDPQLFLIGAALEADLDGERQLASAGITAQGLIVVVAVTPEAASGTSNVREATIIACEDVSQFRAIDQSGTDVTPPERPDRLASRVTLEFVGKKLLISNISTPEVASC